ncbi:MAG: sulfite exporter TauE/SafE family protein [Chloroflexi bacterium]|nr:sulfite exporter TauE/SafE family protein [Chloroflexota bacterium]
MWFPNAEVAVNPALLLLLGVMVGTLSGFFGVGGGFLITGGLLVFGVPPVFAVGTGLALIMGSSIINTLKHRHLGNVDFRLGMLMLIGTIPGVFLAEQLNSALEEAGIVGPVIRYVYILFLGVLGGFIIIDYLRLRRSAKLGGEEISTASLARRVRSLRIPPHSIWLPGVGSVPTYVHLPVSGIENLSVFIPVTVGLGVGFFAGLLGAGGGFLLMPALIYGLGVPTTVAIGTDLFQIVVTGSWGTFIYALSHNVDPKMAIIMLSAASVGSQLGTSATRFVEPARIRILFGVTILGGCAAVALEQISTFSDSVEFLSTVASVVLLSVAGATCLIIGGLMIKAKSGSRELAPTEGGD